LSNTNYLESNNHDLILKKKLSNGKLTLQAPTLQAPEESMQPSKNPNLFYFIYFFRTLKRSVWMQSKNVR